MARVSAASLSASSPSSSSPSPPSPLSPPSSADPPPSQPPLLDEQRDAARARILRAARQVLAARGLAATVDDVAEAAGVNRRTVFRHFATRDGLMAAAIRDGVRSYGLQLPAPPAAGDLREWLVELLGVVHRLNAGHGRVFWE